uniref:Hypotheticial protein n=1 Tax=Schistosoma japonicum TaxID=6182 RepID=C1LGX8_SCHJA|nr:hypotheticial protein [Schistosoma japonicum]
MLFTTFLAILCIHSFVLTYPNNSTNGVALNLNLTKYREICDTVCSDDQNGTQTGNHLLN